MNNERVIKALEAFKKAYWDLIEEIEVSNNEDVYNSISGEHYPLDSSIDEINIPEWVDTSIENLKTRSSEYK